MGYSFHERPGVRFKAILQLYIYKAFMINRVWGLKTTMTTGEWTCLISFARAPPTRKEGKQAKSSKWKYMSPPGIEPATLCFLAGHLDQLANETVNFMCYKLLQ